jgi:hypothetical protein
MMRRRGGPGIVSTMARTAVIAGTATAVSNKVTAGQVAKQQARQQAAADAQAQAQAAADAHATVQELQAQMQALQAQQAQAAIAAAPAAGGGADMMAKLQQLADMKANGLLTDDEFAAAKARLLA